MTEPKVAEEIIRFADGSAFSTCQPYYTKPLAEIQVVDHHGKTVRCVLAEYKEEEVTMTKRVTIYEEAVDD